MDVSLKPELEQFIADKIKAGQYANVDDVVNEALEFLKDREEFTPQHEAYLGREVRRGLEQLDSGQRADFNANAIIADERRRPTGGKSI
jgi:putative addiction module CopG family antidote